MKRNIRTRLSILLCALCAVMLLTAASVGAFAISADVTASSWEGLELKALYIQSGADIYSDLCEDYFEYWWEDEVPERGKVCRACTVNMRGFAMSADGRYLYMGQLNGGSGVRGVVVYDTEKCVVTDLYYLYDGENGRSGNPFSYAKGIAADDRGYVYVGFAFSKNYNVVNLGIARQMDDGTLEEVSLEPVVDLGNAGDETGIKVGVNGVDVAKVGDRYYCYAMINYDYDALYCIDVTDPENPKLNRDFGEDGCIIFSEPSNTVAGDGFTLKEGQYMDVDEDGIIWLAVNSKEGADGIMKIAPDGSACAEVIEMKGVYSVEHEGGFLLCGLKDGSAVVVLDDASYERIATVPLTADYGDRVTRILVINDVLFVADAGDDSNVSNAVHAAPLSPAGQEFFDTLVANMVRTVTGEDTPEDTAEAPVDTAPDFQTEAVPAVTDSPATEAPSAAPATEAPDTDAPAEGCGSTVAFAAVAILAAAAAFVARKKN